MKSQRIYLDTSVIGGCFDKEFATWSLGLIDDFRKKRFVALISEVVASELEEAPDYVQKIYAELLTLSPEIIQSTPETIQLAGIYQERKILTPKFYDDGLHIALATVSQADILVSWNFKHIVHFDKIRLFNAVNLEMGYRPLQIYSPREVTSYGRDDD